MNDQNDVGHDDQIRRWKKELLDDNQTVALAAVDGLAKNGGENIFNHAIDLLKSPKPAVRNIAAILLRDLKDDRAVEPLFATALNPDLMDYSGTLIYALEELNCEHHIVDLFYILFYHEYEAKMMAFGILRTQTFDASKEDLMTIQQMWRKCCLDPNEGLGFDHPETREMMHYMFTGFQDDEE